MRVLVLTVVHHPDDARILHRQIAAIREHGHAVRYAAPFRARAAVPPPGIDAIDVPRAAGRRRWPALVAARRVLVDCGADADLVLVHDPELLLALPGLARRWRRTGSRPPVVVWDVHEDTAAALDMKDYVPRALRGPLKVAVRAVERIASRRLELLLAEDGYRDRFRRPHPVVPNAVVVPPLVPPPGDDRVVYLGQVSRARGGLDLVEMARRLPDAVRLEVIGAADAGMQDVLAAADREGLLTWHGFVPNDKALGMLDGALAGVSLLHDEANYRHSLPTKIVEYMAHGVPVVTTPNPSAAALVRRHGCGAVVPFADPAAAAEAVHRLGVDPALRLAMGRRGHAAALADLDWRDWAGVFVRTLECWVHERDAPRARQAAAAGARAAGSHRRGN
jgi:glycosyltransferase involved in cell wall biosynthesis